MKLLPFCRILLVYLLIESGILVGVLPIAKACAQAIAHAQVLRVGDRESMIKVLGNQRIIIGGITKGLRRHLLPIREVISPLPKAKKHLFIISRIGHHKNIPKILCRGANHGRSADINIFHLLFLTHPFLLKYLFKGIEIIYHKVNGVNSQFFHGFLMQCAFSSIQDSGMDTGMQRLHPPIQNFRKAGQFGNLFHFHFFFQ